VDFRFVTAAWQLSILGKFPLNRAEELWIRDSSFNITTIGVRFLAEARYLSLLCSVQTVSGAQRASYKMGIGGFIPGGNATEV
jgi:hypothetical protein